MKTEELTALGVTPEQAQQILAINGRDIERHKNEAATLRTQLDEANTRLTAANQKLEGYDPEWKAKATAAEQSAQKKIDALRLEHALDSAITGAKGRNAKAIRALIDCDALKLTDSGEVVGLKEQIETIRKDNGFLFEDETPLPAFSRSAPGVTTQPQGNKNAQANAALRSLFGRNE